MADGRLNCHKAGPEEGNNQPSTMKTKRKLKENILQGMKEARKRHAERHYPIEA
jgi:hypothetical protein